MMIYHTQYKIPKISRYNWKKKWYLNAAMAFDTETTTFFRLVGNDGKINWVTQDYDADPDKYSEADKRALVYIWQFAIEGDVVYGREITEFFEFWARFHKINPYTAIVYVHNLGYDFEFLCEYMPNDITVFARSAYRPMYVKSEEMGLELRCSYMLSNMSLEKCAEEFGLSVKKQVGEMAYNVARLPVTPLTDEELEYCEYDVRVIVALINEVFLTRYPRIADIPLTQTGEVRRVVKSELGKIRGHMLDMWKIKPDLELYRVLTRVLQGGYTHLNYLYHGDIIHNVASYDKSSSYPDVICTRKFPCGVFRAVDIWHEDDEKNCYLLYVRYTDIHAKNAWAYIAQHKVDKSDGATVDNGKIAGADMLEMWATEIDYKIIKTNYRIGAVEVLKIYRSYADYLPKRFVELVLEQYDGKTTLKGDPDSYGVYMRMKQMLNANYGMMITNNIREEQVFDPVKKIWKDADPLTDAQIASELKKQRPFLNYAWGIWVTAYARSDLWELINMIGNDCVYCDTDSVKFINPQKHIPTIQAYNARQRARIENVCRVRGLPLENFYPKTQKGVEKPLGYFDDEGIYSDFLSLGSKKYCDVKDGKFEYTVAGLKKTYIDGNGEKRPTMRSMREFRLDAKIANGRAIMWHLTDQPEVELTDYLGNKYTATNKQGIALLNTAYTFTLGQDYDKFLTLMGAIIMDGRNKYTNPFRFSTDVSD